MDALINSANVSKYLYNYSAFDCVALNIKHDHTNYLSITSNINPSTNEILLTIDSITGIKINPSAHILNNLNMDGDTTNSKKNEKIKTNEKNEMFGRCAR